MPGTAQEALPPTVTARIVAKLAAAGQALELRSDPITARPGALYAILYRANLAHPTITWTAEHDDEGTTP